MAADFIRHLMFLVVVTLSAETGSGDGILRQLGELSVCSSHFSKRQLANFSYSLYKVLNNNHS